MIEKEYKALLTREQYKLLERQFDFETDYVQLNIYYAPKERDADTTIRVRIKYNSILLQLKELVSKKDGVHIKYEYEKRLEEIPYQISGEELNALSCSKRYSDSYMLGIMVTRRREFRAGNNAVALDYNQYCGTEDYELEIEFEDTIEKALLDKLKSYHICCGENSCGKFTRFLKHL